MGQAALVATGAACSFDASGTGAAGGGGDGAPGEPDARVCTSSGLAVLRTP